MGFSDFVGHEYARLSLVLNAIEPRCGGVLFAGEKGSGKSTLVRQFAKVLPEETPFVLVPLNVTEEALLGTIDVEYTIRTGTKKVQKGLFSRAHRGILFIDDVNLLATEAVSLVLEVNGRQQIILEREGLSATADASFMLVATMNPEEGHLSPHVLDRFGMCVFWESLREKSQRKLVIQRELDNRYCCAEPRSAADEALYNRILHCRDFLPQVVIAEEIANRIAELCMENGISSHRAEVFLFYATRAYAAYVGHRTASFEDVEIVAPLVLLHRQRQIVTPLQEPSATRESQYSDAPSSPSNNAPSDEQETGQKHHHPQTQFSSFTEDRVDKDMSFSQGPAQEHVFGAGQPFPIKRLVFRKDRVRRVARGRRTQTNSKDKGGRYVRSILSKRDDVAIDATIRAAAPYQRVRNRCDILLIQESDLRYKQREKKTGHLVIFVVDGSGSMGAQKRMVETKGAVKSLLMDCYQKRDKVAMIVFRNAKAEIVLQPTSSVEHAARRLQEIPTGGKTPLSAGLLESYELIQRHAKKAPETRFLLVLVTDGRANQALSDLPVKEEVRRIARLIGELPHTDTVVVDTENKTSFLAANLALPLAAELDADYYTIENLKADYLVELVQKNKTN